MQPEPAPTNAPSPKRPTIHPLLKMALELGPLALFLIAFWRTGNLFIGTGLLMAAVVVALAVSYAMLRRLPTMPLVTAVMVVIFGSLTLYLHDKTFIKMKLTALDAMFGLALLGGIAFNRPLLPILFDGALNISAEGWRKLTWRWAGFFFAMAALNELIWRTQSDGIWASFRSFGVIGLTLLFALAQTPLVMRYEVKADEAEEAL